ncbi:MAG: (2Fe-2S)-binding protein [Gammaproteobacteria bacterium]|nr:(2Fe-2S)-binding protein [Gammaproteobacteria bacterium]MDH3986031.1 (2Fe-2S)-binding protein [Gammaproteobacteria bacterium]
MYICICNKITDSDIRRELENGACSLQCLQKRLKVATCCGRCEDCAKRLIHESININLSTELQSAVA